jgi:hypothetical protein
MMHTQEYLGRSRLFRRLKSGPHGQLVERYAARLVENGFVRHGTWRCLNVVGGLLSWMATSRSDLADLDERMSGVCFARLRSSWSPPLAPPAPPPVARHCSSASRLLSRSQTSHGRASSASARYSFTVRDLHPLLLAGLPAHSENLQGTKPREGNVMGGAAGSAMGIWS